MLTLLLKYIFIEPLILIITQDVAKTRIMLAEAGSSEAKLGNQTCIADLPELKILKAFISLFCTFNVLFFATFLLISIYFVNTEANVPKVYSYKLEMKAIKY